MVSALTRAARLTSTHQSPDAQMCVCKTQERGAKDYVSSRPFKNKSSFFHCHQQQRILQARAAFTLKARRQHPGSSRPRSVLGVRRKLSTPAGPSPSLYVTQFTGGTEVTGKAAASTGVVTRTPGPGGQQLGHRRGQRPGRTQQSHMENKKAICNGEQDANSFKCKGDRSVRDSDR